MSTTQAIPDSEPEKSNSGTSLRAARVATIDRDGRGEATEGRGHHRGALLRFVARFALRPENPHGQRKLQGRPSHTVARGRQAGKHSGAAGIMRLLEQISEAAQDLREV